MGAQHEEGRFQTMAEALKYLKQSWMVTKTTLYRHKNEGKLLPQDDGTFLHKDVLKYAKTWLKQKSTGKKVRDNLDDLQRRKLEKELETLDLELNRKKLLFEKEREKYIPREQMDIELAARAGILDAGLKHWIQSKAAEWIRTTEGDSKKIGELINLMIRDLDEHMNSYASIKEFQVVFDEAEEEMEVM